MNFQIPKQPAPSYTCGRCNSSQEIIRGTHKQQLEQYQKWADEHRACKWPEDKK